jgi:glucosamine 6-phosphate synthetase-like amidotransferase/phosphosugar isomerase protein
VAVVHNGIIENFAELKDELLGRGVRFDSETDTEVMAHLLARGSRPGSRCGRRSPPCSAGWRGLSRSRR